ncbi:MAG TPA: Lrp/AsnC ligand binding domain-containing protein [Methylomirabilota bacterium]|nr:Lrp/AsnC ligand binding domain-containing protein [Methylomirabilota bacterium]
MPRLLAFVNIFVESPTLDDVVQALSQLSNVEELYEVTGEFDVVTLVSAADIEEFRDFVKNKLLKIKGIKSTVTSIVLNAPKGPRNGAHGTRSQ